MSLFLLSDISQFKEKMLLGDFCFYKAKVFSFKLLEMFTAIHASQLSSQECTLSLKIDLVEEKQLCFSRLVGGWVRERKTLSLCRETKAVTGN